jgi:hypothetical protein
MSLFIICSVCTGYWCIILDTYNIHLWHVTHPKHSTSFHIRLFIPTCMNSGCVITRCWLVHSSSLCTCIRLFRNDRFKIFKPGLFFRYLATVCLLMVINVHKSDVCLHFFWTRIGMGNAKSWAVLRKKKPLILYIKQLATVLLGLLSFKFL